MTPPDAARRPRHDPRHVDGFAVAALVVGVLGGGAVAFALGAIGLHRTGRGRSAGRGLAVTGLVLGALVMVAASGTVLALLLAGGLGTRLGVDGSS